MQLGQFTREGDRDGGCRGMKQPDFRVSERARADAATDLPIGIIVDQMAGQAGQRAISDVQNRWRIC